MTNSGTARHPGTGRPAVTPDLLFTLRQAGYLVRMPKSASSIRRPRLHVSQRIAADAGYASEGRSNC